MALVRVAGPLEQVEAFAKPGVERIGREKLCARSCELQSERQPIEALAEPLNRLDHLDVRANCAGALEEERDRVVVHEWWQVELVLSADSQRLATGDDEPHGRDRLGQFSQKTGGVGKQMLEVVDDYVRSLLTDTRGDCRDIPGRCAESFADRRQHKRRLAKRREGTEDRTAFRFVG